LGLMPTGVGTGFSKGTAVMAHVYRVLAYLVAALVVVQAAAIGYAVFGLAKWIDAGGTLDKGVFESGGSVGGEAGFATHGIFGTMVIPIVALLFLISSFFAKVPGGVKWAAITFGLVVLQVALGLFSHELAGLGWLHGANALVLFAVAVMSGMRVRRALADRTGAPVAAPAAGTPVA
jgi:uncharacterized protein DUF6220